MNIPSLFTFPHQPTVNTNGGQNKALAERNFQPPQKTLVGDAHKASKVADKKEIEGVSTQMVMQSISARAEHSADIQITTTEGDVVTVRLREEMQSSQSYFSAEQQGNEIVAYSESELSLSSFSLSIDGDLNADEQKSLADLINKMTEVSDEFFGGDINVAFQHAQKVGFDTEQIAGFSMDLRKEESVQAVAAYQQTKMPEQNVNADLLKQAGDFIADAKMFMAETAVLLDSIAEPEQAFVDLFAGIAQMSEMDGELIQESTQPLFLKMVENMGHDIFS